MIWAQIETWDFSLLILVYKKYLGLSIKSQNSSTEQGHPVSSANMSLIFESKTPNFNLPLCKLCPTCTHSVNRTYMNSWLSKLWIETEHPSQKLYNFFFVISANFCVKHSALKNFAKLECKTFKGIAGNWFFSSEMKINLVLVQTNIRSNSISRCLYLQYIYLSTNKFLL